MVASLYEAVFLEERFPLWHCLEQGKWTIFSGLFLISLLVTDEPSMNYSSLFLMLQSNSPGGSSQIKIVAKRVLTVCADLNHDEEQVSNRAQRLKTFSICERNGYRVESLYFFEGSERYQILTNDVEPFRI